MTEVVFQTNGHDEPNGNSTSRIDLAGTLENAQKLYTKRNPKSLEVFNETLDYMPGSNTRSVLHTLPFPMVISHGKGATLTSVDGDTYIDFLGEYSAGVYGHSNDKIKTAIVDAMNKGWNFGGKNEYEGKLAKTLVERFGNGMEMVRFCNSGTEANLMAVGAAINYTQKRKILAFIGGYHGSSISFPEATPKYTMNANYEFILAPYNDISGTDAVVAELPSDSLAAILVEGMQGAGGCIPGRTEFLQHLRKIADDQKALLILDEVMTSRLAYKGLQSLVGIKPDITTLGKWPGGGMSFGAFGARREIMEMFDPRNGKLIHSGTFNNNIFTMAAGLAGCAILDEPTLNKLNSRGELLRSRINETIGKYLDSATLNAATRKMYATGMGSLLTVHFVGPHKDKLQALFYHYMLEQGIYLATRGYMALNIEITEEHIESFAKALDGFLVDYHSSLI